MGKNKVMEAKNRKVRMHDMRENTYRNNNRVATEYMFHEAAPPKDDGNHSRYEYAKFMWEHAEAIMRYKKYLESMCVGEC